MPLRRIEHLDECYLKESGTLLLTGMQALVRLLLTQSYRDERAGLETAGYVSGYRGSPLGGLDRELWRAQRFLEAAHIHFQPGLNEDLAATSVWGSQQANIFPGARFDGVFGLWYGKGPGVDRSGDAFKHGNAAGSAARGGVLVVAGDDHACRSSSLPHQSELAFVDALLPVLNPADVSEVIELGLYGYELSRFSGCWVALKITQETADATQSVKLEPDRIEIVRPDFALPPGGLNIRWPDPPVDQEARLHYHKLPAALAFARANRLNRIVIDAPQPRLGIVTTGKAHLDVMQALEDLGIDAQRAAELGLRVLKVGMSWPLEPQSVRAFASGLEEILVVEEKRGLVEGQIKEQLYDWPAALRPRILGKLGERGEPLLPSTGELNAARVTRVLAARLGRFYSGRDIDERLRFLEGQERQLGDLPPSPERLPHFCSGCPHNTSTHVPEGSRAVGGIGCHFMAGWMDRSTVTYTQMGGEGATWIGQAPFTQTPHIFQNIGDGTYAHSGSLAIRAAVAAGVNITFKVLYNDAVAMTGGQPVEGNLSVARVVQQLEAEGVAPIVVVTDDPRKYARGQARHSLPPSVAVRDRRELDSIQRTLREVQGVSALVYDQSCASELHRKRKRGQAPPASRRVAINELVCEGCGDCNLQSSCLSVMPLETEFGRKRRINQSSCNQDFRCLEGFCPSFVSLEGAERRPPMPLASETVPNLPEPAIAPIESVYNILIAGVGGTGVVTASGLLGLAAHLERKAVRQLDQTGLAQRFGAVLSHLRISPDAESMHGMRIPAGQVDLAIGADLLVAGGREALAMLSPERSAVIVNTHHEMPSNFIRDRNFQLPGHALLTALRARSGRCATLDATRLASALLGDSVAANVFLLGYAFQLGRLPVGGGALYRALELFGVNVEQNKLAFDWGRYAAHDLAAVERLAGIADPAAEHAGSLEDVIARRERFLEDYQDRAYALRYRRRVEQIRMLEERIAPGKTDLSDAVARYYFKLLAYKDEYEVARLHTQTGFLDSLRRNFGNDFKLRFHLSPPLVARLDPSTGRPKKYAFGAWMLPLLRLLSQMKHLRGGRFDIFGYTKERRMERRLIEDYERLLDFLVNELDRSRYSLALRLAALPDAVRGFGPIKQQAVADHDAERGRLLGAWEEGDRAAVEEQASAA
ncbi:MAG TPA: indolepyruvate ferredoxin oxidoreductase family protein [Gammaproteobacteria bacterium]|nr:indolepyruvate ferredoxin oxidoreductase family protein [Gammaproteobacteria bacterium]